MKLIGILAKSSMEWMISDLSSILYGVTIVPFFETYAPA